MKPKSLIFILLALLVCLLSGCSSTRFKREWKKAPQTISNPQGMEGRWEGKWLSDKNGHTGKLLCIVQNQDDGMHRFHFYATFWKLFSGAYTTSFEVTGEKDAYSVSGTHLFPKLFGGLYSYQGSATETNFNATYECQIDEGTFTMTRFTPKEN